MIDHSCSCIHTMLLRMQIKAKQSILNLVAFSRYETASRCRAYYCCAWCLLVVTLMTASCLTSEAAVAVEVSVTVSAFCPIAPQTISQLGAVQATGSCLLQISQMLCMEWLWRGAVDQLSQYGPSQVLITLSSESLEQYGSGLPGSADAPWRRCMALFCILTNKLGGKSISSMSIITTKSAVLVVVSKAARLLLCNEKTGKADSTADDDACAAFPLACKLAKLISKHVEKTTASEPQLQSSLTTKTRDTSLWHCFCWKCFCVHV